MQKIKSFFSGATTGLLNALFGAGGGIIIIPYLKAKGLSQKSAQASALPVLIVMSTVSAISYLGKGYFSLKDGIIFIPFGFLGALAGSFLMGKIPDRLLNIAFSLFLLYSGIRMLLR
ncbi:MAG: sulfite exporter TauE/SafE family protein [Clostridia bacterium]|nr:sulfite exporter TauE/SafE family protein [Clostridia bacterium]